MSIGIKCCQNKECKSHDTAVRRDGNFYYVYCRDCGTRDKDSHMTAIAAVIAWNKGGSK